MSKAEVGISSVVEKDGQSVASFIEFSATDDPQVLQRKIVKLVQSHQHVTRHLPDRLQRHRYKYFLLDTINNLSKT